MALLPIRRATLLLAGLGPLLLVGAMAVPVAQAGTLGCGSVITMSTTLASDIGPCPGDGLVIGADNLTLDLGKHRVLGSSDRSDGRVGIRLTSRTGVTLKSGDISGFAAGVAIAGGSANTVTRLTVHDNVGPALRFVDFGDGILIDGSSDNLVVGNRVGPNNGPLDGMAVISPNANGNRILSNEVVDNNVGAPLTTDPDSPGPFNFDEGIVVSTLSGDTSQKIRDTTIGGNTVKGNGANGIKVILHVQNTLVEANRVERNGFGSFNAANGGYSGQGYEDEGILFNHGAGNSIITGNIVRKNADGGILLATCCGNPFTQFSVNNQVLDNTSKGNAALNQLTDLGDDWPDCGTDVWRGNKWGAYPGTDLGSFYPDCVTTDGSGPRPGIFSEASAESASSLTAAATAEPPRSDIAPLRNRPAG